MKLIHQQRAEARIGHKFCCSPTDHDCVAVPLSAMLPLLVLGTQNLGTRRECNLKTQATMLTITRTARKHCTRARYTLHTYTATHRDKHTHRRRHTQWGWRVGFLEDSLKLCTKLHRQQRPRRYHRLRHQWHHQCNHFRFPQHKPARTSSIVGQRGTAPITSSGGGTHRRQQCTGTTERPNGNCNGDELMRSHVVALR